MRKLTTLLLLLLSPLVMAQEEAIEDIYLQCVPATEEAAAVAVFESHILLIRSDDTWMERALFKQSSLGYVESPFVSFDGPQSRFGGIPVTDLVQRQREAIDRARERIAEKQIVARRLDAFTLMFDNDTRWTIDRISGIATVSESSLEDNCVPLTSEEFNQVLNDYNQRLRDAKNKVIETRKF